MKPKTWQELPPAILEMLLENVDLSYDRYESSRAEIIYEILNFPSNAVSRENAYKIQEALDNLSEEQFKIYCRHAIDNAERIINDIKPYLS